MEETVYAILKGKKDTNSSINDLTQFSLHLSRFRDKEHIVTSNQCYACESHVNSYIKPCKCKIIYTCIPRFITFTLLLPIMYCVYFTIKFIWGRVSMAFTYTYQPPRKKVGCVCVV